jgi:nucleoside-diphosphate-sugar epimerase
MMGEPATIETGKDTQVVIGAAKPLGRAVVEELAASGSRVRGVVLGAIPVSDPFPASVEVVSADPLKPGSMVEACKGGKVVYDCFEPSYSNWKTVYPQVTTSVLLASIEVGADLVFASHLIAEEGENAHQEKDLFNANLSNLIRTLVVRMPQLYGERVVNALWQHIFESAALGKKAHWMGDPEVARSLLYVGDAASKMILLGRSLWAYGHAWNLSGPTPISGRSFIENVFRAAGREPNVGHWGRGVMLTGRLLGSDAKEFLALPYNYYDSFVLDGSEFREAFPSAPYIPHDEAIARTYRWFAARP